MQGKYEIKGFSIQMNELIGEGSNGKYFLCYKMDQPELKLCAEISDPNEENSEAKRAIFKKLTESSKHCPNIVKTYLAEYIDNLNKIVIIMELCESDLEKEIKKNRYYAEPEALKIFQQIVLGYQFLYENCIIHRDLKPGNIFIQSGLYKIAGFEDGRFIDRNLLNKLTKRGSPVYQAPEFFQSDENYVIATDKVDVYSLGILFYEILYGELPQEKDRRNISMKSLKAFINGLQEGQKIYFPEEPKVSDQTKQLIEQMLKIEPNDRIGWEDIFKHQYFQIVCQPKQNTTTPILYQPPRSQIVLNPNNPQQLQPNPKVPIIYRIPQVIPIQQNIPYTSEQNQQLSIIFAWILDMQRIIEEQCNVLLLGTQEDQVIINNLITQLGNVLYYYNINLLSEQMKLIYQQIQKDNQQPIDFKQNIYNNLGQHLQILQYIVKVKANKRYPIDYCLFHRFLQNLSQKKYNFENTQLMSQQIQQDYKEIGRNSKK